MQSSCGISRFQVQPQFLHTPLDTATEKQFKATLVQDLRRFAEAQNIGDQSEEPRETLYDWLVHALITFRLPMSPRPQRTIDLRVANGRTKLRNEARNE
ncbi:unnamed protein product [Effrenium voratum]|nr:unnamed protein product [Effrenium voratum]